MGASTLVEQQPVCLAPHAHKKVRPLEDVIGEVGVGNRVARPVCDIDLEEADAFGLEAVGVEVSDHREPELLVARLDDPLRQQVGALDVVYFPGAIKAVGGSVNVSPRSQILLAPLEVRQASVVGPFGEAERRPRV